MVWGRIPGNIIFSAGGLILAWFTFHFWRGSRGLPATLPIPVESRAS